MQEEVEKRKRRTVKEVETEYKAQVDVLRARIEQLEEL